jgi:hypothetical protein
MGVSSTVVTLAAESVDNDAARATAYAIQLQRSLQAIEDGRQQAPRDRWDPQYIVDTVGLDPAVLYRWERENVGWVPYRGQLRGPTGVLMDRRGNSLDMSLLLAKLMTLAGLKARLAHATLPDDVVDLLWDDLATTAAIAAAAPPSTGDTAMLAAPVTPAPLKPAGRAEEPAVITRTAASDTPSGSLFAGAGDESGSLFGASEEDNTAPQSPADVAALYDLNAESGTETLTTAADLRDSVTDDLQARVTDQGARLLSLFKPATQEQSGDEQARDRTALADHWWVQVEDGGTWTDYDLLAPEATAGAAVAAAAETMDTNVIPDNSRQHVELKVVAEQLVGDQLRQSTLLAHDFDPSAVIGERISLHSLPLLWPSDWDAITPDDVQEKLFAALYTQTEWMPMLTVGDEAYQQQSIRDTGEPNPNPEPQSNPFLSLAFPAAGKVGRITDLFGQMLDESAGLGGDAAAPEAAPENAPRPQGELTAEWLEYTIYVPGEAPKVVRRALFDILGDAMRRSGDFSTFRVDEDARLKRAAGEMVSTDIVIMPCWPASEYIADLTAGVALANKPVLDEFAKDPFGKAPPNSIELFSKMSAVAGPAYFYQMLRSQSTVTNASVFVDRPQIVTQHEVLTRVGPGELTSKAALDVVENGVGADPFGGRDPFMLRLLQGVADTNAEALAMPEGGDNVANAFAQPSGATASPEWVALFPGDAERVASLGLAPDLAERLKGELDAGNAIVLPPDPGEAAKYGWWRVDPASGATLGIGSLGWGQDLVEYAFQLVIQAMMAQIACMAFTAAAEEKISSLTAEQGRDKIKTWARNCVSQALLETIAGLSTSWIQSRFLEGAKVPTWNDRAKTSATPHGSFTPHTTTTPHDALPPTATPRTTPPHEDTPPTATPRTTPPHEDTPPTATPRTTPPHEDTPPTTKPRTTPPTEEGGNSRPRTTPPTEEGNTGPRKTPPTDEEGGSTRRPPTTEDDSLDGKTILDPNCVAEAYEVRVASLEEDALPIRSDAEKAPLLVAATCPTGNGKPQPAEPEGPPAPQQKQTPEGGEGSPASPKPPPADLDSAQKNYDAALDAYRKDPSAANREALTEALHGLDRAQAANPRPQPAPPPEPSANLKSAQQNYDAALDAYRKDPSLANRDALTAALKDLNRAQFPPKDAGANPARPPVQGEEGAGSAKPGPQGEPEGPPTPRPPAEAEGPPSPQTPPAGPSPAKTQPMENAPPLPPQNDTERVAAIRAQTDARIAAEREYQAADAAFDADPKNPANIARLEAADAAYNKAHMAELDAWQRAGGRGFPPTKEAGLSPDDQAPPQAAEPVGPPTPPATPAGKSPNAQSVATPARPVGPVPATPEEVAPIAPPQPAQAANTTQPMENAPPLPPQTPSQKAAAIRSYTDAIVAAHDAEIAAGMAMVANDNPQTQQAYQQAVLAADRARVLEVRAWSNLGGAGVPPSRSGNMLQPQPQALTDFLMAKIDAAAAQPPNGGLAGGTNTTLAMGLGSLAGTIQRGP